MSALNPIENCNIHFIVHEIIMPGIKNLTCKWHFKNAICSEFHFFYYVTYWLRSCWNHHFRTTIATIISYLVLQTLFNYLFSFSFTGIDLLVIADDGIIKKKTSWSPYRPVSMFIEFVITSLFSIEKIYRLFITHTACERKRKYFQFQREWQKVIRIFNWMDYEIFCTCHVDFVHWSDTLQGASILKLTLINAP